MMVHDVVDVVPGQIDLMVRTASQDIEPFGLRNRVIQLDENIGETGDEPVERNAWLWAVVSLRILRCVLGCLQWHNVLTP